MYNLEAHAERTFVLVPVGAKHFEAANLGGRADVAADAWAYVVVADTYQSDGVGGILGQAVGADLSGQLVARDEFEGDGQVLVDEALHLAFYVLLFLSGGLVVKTEAHLALLALDMCIIGTLTAEEPYHRLVQEVFRRMCRRKLLFVMFIQNKVFHLEI